ncbi:MAG: site-specific DNA-methyltransferase [Bacteroidales bacterium]|nr:site-specific DNA-methyltransferase [Bacteroidales bacterium]
MLQGDCLEVLKTLPDGFVDCCVTSPPYYGLRDYGTGTWVGGDPSCPHKRLNKVGTATSTGHAQAELAGNVGDSIYKSVCPLCGAVRVDKQIGLEETPEEYIQKLTDVFREVRRVMKDDGTLWVNIGDTYNGNKQGNTETVKHSAIAGKQDFAKKLWDGAKQKDLIGIPWMLAFALRADGWYLRQDIIWHKPNPMPESVKDRCTKSHEYIFLLSKKQQYYFDYEAIQEPATGYDGRKDTVNKGSRNYANASYLQDGNQQAMAVKGHERWQYKNLADQGQTPNSMHVRRADGQKDIVYPVRNKRDVWTVPTKPIKEAHFATFPEDLIRPCILAGSRAEGVVLDPFFGSGTTGRVAISLNRKYLGIELNPEYIQIEKKRTDGVQLSFEGLKC